MHSPLRTSRQTRRAPRLASMLSILAAALFFAGFALFASRPEITADSVSAQGGTPPGTWRLYGHDNSLSSIIQIDTATGLASLVGRTGYSTSASGMATSRAHVIGAPGSVIPAGAHFGLLSDVDIRRDRVVAVDTITGAATSLSVADRSFSGRGVGFGPDGATFFVADTSGSLWTVEVRSGYTTEIGRLREDDGTRHTIDNLEFDPDSGFFIAISNGPPVQVVRVDPASGAIEPIAPIDDISVCTISRAPGPVAGPGGIIWPAGTWFTIDSRTSQLATFEFDVTAGTANVGTIIGPLGPESSGTVCGTAFAEPRAVIPSPMPTPSPSQTPPPSSECVCDIVRDRVPAAVIADALANPNQYYGWGVLLDPGKPAGPGNPVRECLSLINLNIDYHPLWNRPIWRVGCAR